MAFVALDPTKRVQLQAAINRSPGCDPDFLKRDLQDKRCICCYDTETVAVVKVRFYDDAARFHWATGGHFENLYNLGIFSLAQAIARWPEIADLETDATVFNRDTADRWAARMAADRLNTSVRARVVQTDATSYRVEGPTVAQALRDYKAR